ncbi:DUF3298 domain-containing protein [Dysgonomonas sp. 216]|uniref:RsiV family protein n=1 Tax=Dysgonomonas sp. 216 TaxID=2302934 RepID=UPI0013D693F3|nr:RsiV family protein [Dysgonomonas sp. 216]NDW17695.1 DUF3298 domain-containing protein [Dysgonomonas sp. 216]
MKKFFVLLASVWVVFSCTTPDPKPTFEHLATERTIYISNDSAKPFMKLNLEFVYPSTYANDTLLANIQKLFVLAFAGKDYAGRSPKGAFEAYEKSLMDEYVDIARDFGGESAAFFGDLYQTIKTEIIDDSLKNIVIVKTTNESYMGGAHGSYIESYYNIDMQKALLLKEKELFGDENNQNISQLITKSLQDKYGESIHDVLFEIDSIQPNGNFYINADGITYVYNQYEIAPYSSGIIKAFIPYEKVKEFLKPEYSEILIQKK